MNSISVTTTANRIEVVDSPPNQIVVQKAPTPVLVEVSTPGPQGPAGSVGSSSFLHQQTSPSSEWMITHNFNKFPNVITTDFAGEVFYGLVTHLDENVVLLSFAAPLSGKAYLS